MAAAVTLRRQMILWAVFLMSWGLSAGLGWAEELGTVPGPATDTVTLLSAGKVADQDNATYFLDPNSPGTSARLSGAVEAGGLRVSDTFRVEVRSADPSAPEDGRIWFVQ